MARKIQLRRDTAANWTSTNPVLAQGEIGLDITNMKIKIGIGGDPGSRWNNLPYWDDEETSLSNYAGHIVPSTDNTYDLGAPDKQWRDIYVSNGSVYIGDIKLSNDSGTLLVQQVTDPGLETEEPVPDAPGVVTTDRLVHGEWTVNLSSDGTLIAPSAIAFGDGNRTNINQVNNNFVITTNTGPGNPYSWTFDEFGNLTLPGGAVIDTYNNGGENATYLWSAPGEIIAVRGIIAEGVFGGGIDINPNGTVGIVAQDGEASTGWSFNVDGSLTLPNLSVIAVDGTNVEVRNVTNFNVEAAGVVNIYTDTEGSGHQWQFGDDGNLQLPAGGDIVDSTGNSVLGGGGGSIAVGDGSGPSVENVTEILINGTVTEIEPGLVGVSVTPNIPNTKKGFINLVGNRPNDEDDVFFESVAVHEQYAYVLGEDEFTDGSDDLPTIWKFNLETGELVWTKKIIAGSGAEFDFEITSEVITITNIVSGGGRYLVNEELHFYGWRWNGNDITNLVTVVVDSVDEDGIIQSVSIKPGYNLTGISDGTFTNQIADNDNAVGTPVGITYDTDNDVVIVVQEYRSGQGDAVYDTYWEWVNVHAVNPSTGNIVETTTLATNGDIYPNAVRVNPNTGQLVVAGEKYGEFRQFGTLTILNGYNGYFDILKSDLDPEHYPGSPYDDYYDFWISGTGIANVNNVNGVNEYPNLSTTVRQGSGAVFEIDNTGEGTYYTAGTLNPGINYRAGHKIKVLGTDLGGATPANDCIITVDSVGPSGDVAGWSVSGTAAGTTYTTYSGVSGTAYQSGSGLTVNAFANGQTGAVGINYFGNYGTGYVNGDVVTIAGTLFSGGTSPTNDVTFTINNVGGSGEAYGWDNTTVTGSAPNDRLRIRVDGVDFSTPGGSWTMKQSLDGEAFLWTQNWSNAIGGPSGDRFYDFCWSQDNNSIFAVGRGRYETTYNQALVVKFNASTGAVIWGKDIKFSEAASENREARAVCLVPGSSDIIVVGGWYNSIGTQYDEMIVTRLTEAGVAVWQKLYFWNDNAAGYDVDFEFSINPMGNNVVIGADLYTPDDNGIGYVIIDPANGDIVDHRVLSADGNGNRVGRNASSSQWSAVYSPEEGEDYFIGAGYTLAPTDGDDNGLLIKLPLDGYKNLNAGEKVSLGEHILASYMWAVSPVTPAFDSFTATEHTNTIESGALTKNFQTAQPSNASQVFRFDITDDSLGYLEFGDGSKQSFATHVIPQIPAANDYYLTAQDSGKHIFFESESGEVYIPHWTVENLPVGFTVTIVNTTGSNCYITCLGNLVGDNRGRLKLAGRNLETSFVGVPDSGSGSMVTLLKVKSGYDMNNTEFDTVYPDIWVVSGPGDLFDAD